MLLDDVQIGLTHDYDTNWNTYCGVTADTAQKCLDNGLSTGVFVIPSGAHTVGFTSISTGGECYFQFLLNHTACRLDRVTNSLRSLDPAWASSSAMFYKVEKYCP